MENEETTEAMLRQWRDLEPDRCNYSEHYGDWLVLCCGVMDHVHYANRLDDARIHGAACDAIKARGWNWERHINMMRPYTVYVSTEIGPGNEWPNYTGRTVLEAYLIALTYHGSTQYTPAA